MPSLSAASALRRLFQPQSTDAAHRTANTAATANAVHRATATATAGNTVHYTDPAANADHRRAANAAAASLETCTNLAHLPQLHAHLLRRNLLLVTFHWNALSRCYLRLSLPRRSLLLLPHLLRSGSLPDPYSLPLALAAASRLFSLHSALQLHSLAIKLNLSQHEFTESGLISIYCKTGLSDLARKLFDENPERKLGSWNALINGLAQSGKSAETIDAFIDLRKQGLIPDDVTMVSVASACGSLGAVGLAMQVHKCAIQARRTGRLDVMVANSILDMYAKCGRTELALKVFDTMRERNVSSWTSMIMGMATHGGEEFAVELFGEMVREGVRPNGVTMVGMLTACTHGGMVEEGMAWFEKMGAEFGVEATVAHYGCVVDMLGRAGRVEEARKVVETMPMEANAVIWGTLLGACEKHGNVEIGQWAGEKLAALEPWNDGVYVVLSNIFAGAEMWEEVEGVRKVMRQRKVAKTPGYSAAT